MREKRDVGNINIIDQILLIIYVPNRFCIKQVTKNNFLKIY